MTALPSTPCQNAEMRKQDVAHQREMALNTLSEIANVFDFPDLNRFLTNETEIELGSLLRQDFQGLHNELLLRIGEHYQQVFNGLSILASFASSDDPYQGPRDITSPELMADYLQPKLLGILAFFNMQLLSSSVGIEDKKMEKLIKYATDSETVEPVISQLVTVLLKGCQDANSQARLLCGECLGELGAIDPGRLDFSTTETQGKDFTFVITAELKIQLLMPFRPDYNEMVGECWLQSARVARKAGHHQTAYNALLNAGESRLAELYVERAKWLWSKGDVHQALIVLQKGVELCFPENKTPTESKNMLIHGRAMLLVGRFMEETANFESNAVMKKYKDVTLFLPEWEDGHFYLAKYYDKLMPMVTDNKMEKQGDLIRYIVLHFGR
ncbi:hypothetical protein CB1_001390012 [Camelus ferus]|nr:hypothetical protein CB1_001390012 [Camelus ferus]